MTPLEGLTYWLAVLLYSITFGFGFMGLLFRKERMVRFSCFSLWAGFGSHTAAFFSRYIQAGHIPTIGNYENILTGTLVIVAVSLWFFRKRSRFPGLLGTLPFVILLMGFAVVSDTAQRPFVASLQSFWLYIHIFFAWLAYGSFTAAAGVAVAYLAALRQGNIRDDFNELMFRLTALGLVTDAVMIASGSIWAKDLWGSYWSWDPVETWSLISFLLYGLVLHLRVTLGWKGKRLAWILIVALVTVLVSFWGVNFVMDRSLHVFNVG
ncbi:MAG TPA: cytochrome c biogenesis protein CcsA [Thermoanaerobaculia bacterium]|nr:cytochrome c biogenesis protein CcsA [Thermoanaerobaculia bacterium]HUM29114.1 cytochrome c biogenesis protein CcsA [Thermoanaerobaculia bacterium]HXK67491.1 cytochrome c biogenesis protein CcsA [Thermoanaerobaculia bacterium]